jgi:hypothetical protein
VFAISTAGMDQSFDLIHARERCSGVSGSLSPVGSAGVFGRFAGHDVGKKAPDASLKNV